MKTMALLFLLTASVVVASAQSPSINQPAAPVTIRVAKVTEFLIRYEGAGGGNVASPSYDRFNGPDTLVRYGRGNMVSNPDDHTSAASNPDEFTSSAATYLIPMENPKSSPKVSSKAFFSIALTNTGSKPIKGLTFQFLFSNLATGAQYASYEKRMRVKIKPGEEKWLSSQVSMRKPSDDLLKAIKSGQNKNDIQLLLVEYADGSVWSRP